MTLYELTGQFKQLLEMIESGEYHESELKDTIEGIEGEIEIKADGYAKIIKELEGSSNTIKAEIDRLSNKKTYVENNIKNLKQSLETAMKTTGKLKFKTDLFSFGIQKNQAKLVIDKPGEIPTDFLVPQEPKIDNAKIKELLKETELPYAHLEQSESLRIR